VQNLNVSKAVSTVSIQMRSQERVSILRWKMSQIIIIMPSPQPNEPKSETTDRFGFLLNGLLMRFLSRLMRRCVHHSSLVCLRRYELPRQSKTSQHKATVETRTQNKAALKPHSVGKRQHQALERHLTQMLPHPDSEGHACTLLNPRLTHENT